jgi:hypothetical protein
MIKVGTSDLYISLFQNQRISGLSGYDNVTFVEQKPNDIGT